jgi:hypothetical protein
MSAVPERCAGRQEKNKILLSRRLKGRVRIQRRRQAASGCFGVFGIGFDSGPWITHFNTAVVARRVRFTGYACLAHDSLQVTDPFCMGHHRQLRWVDSRRKRLHVRLALYYFSFFFKKSFPLFLGGGVFKKSDTIFCFYLFYLA